MTLNKHHKETHMIFYALATAIICGGAAVEIWIYNQLGYEVFD